MRKVAINKLWSRGEFLRESPVGGQGAGGRPIETTPAVLEAKWDFEDQTAVDAYVEARGGAAGEFVILDLATAGVV